MDLDFTSEELAFRDEVRRFVDAELPGDIRARIAAGKPATYEDRIRWGRILGRKGWLASRWPKEHGGPGWTPVQQYIFDMVLQSAPAPDIPTSGTGLVGPVIYTFGNEAQKHRFLPGILSFEDWWAQGFSEPGAGSDLAALRCTARREGDDYIVDGQKTWTTYAQYSNWIFCLVRTDADAKKQEGISFLLIDMASPGITLRPIITMEGGHEVNEVFFDAVRVPTENLVGEENGGWNYAKFLLGNERVSAAFISQSIFRVRWIKANAAEVSRGGKALADDPRFRQRLAVIEAELKALEITGLRVVAGMSKGSTGQPDPASSILKLKGSEIKQALSELMLEMAGPYALRRLAVDVEEPGPTFASIAAPSYFNWRKSTIYGGTSEIQRGIVAKQILGL